MLLKLITPCLLLVGSLSVSGYEDNHIANPKEKPNSNSNNRDWWIDLHDLEADEDSSIRYQEVLSEPVRIRRVRNRNIRKKRDTEEALDLLAVEDSSTNFKRITPEDKLIDDRSRTKRNPQSWRTPRDYQFVTRTSRQDPVPTPLARSSRLIESGGRFYDERTSYQDYNQRNNQRTNNRNQPEINRRTNFPNRRIIYYATLPEPTRRPDYDRYLRQYEKDYRDREYDRQYYYDKYNTDRYYNTNYDQDYDRFNDYYSNRYDQNNNYNRQYDTNYNRPLYSGYPSIRDNEITRVSSSIIDVTNKDERKERERGDPGLSKFVIIDREPPYLKDVYNFISSFRPSNDEKYTEFLSQYNKEEVTHERNTKKPPRKQSSVPIPPVELTVFKGKPIEIRPLDLSVETSSNTSNKDRPTSTHKPTTLNPIQEFERTYKY